MAEHSVEIRGDGAFISLALSHRAYPEVQDYWDGNRIVTRIQAEAQGFRADLTDQVHLGDVVWFYESILKVHAAMSGEATLAMMEEFLIVTGKMDVRGGISWSAMVVHPLKRSTRLQFTFRADQSCLPALIQGVEDVLVEFDVRGRP